MSDIERAIVAVLAGQPHDPFEEERLRSIVDDLVRTGCRGIVDKLLEARTAPFSRFEALIGELRLALSVSRQLTTAIRFDVGDAADIQFAVDGCHCLLEVVHKSAPSALAAVFYPTPADLQRYVNGSAWQQAALSLHNLIATLPITVQPWVTAAFAQPQVGWKARADQKNACGELASWLIANLPAAVTADQSQLRYNDGRTYFELSAIDAALGYMRGHISIETWLGSEDTLRNSIEHKNSKARKRLDATGADAYLVGLAVDDAWSSRGHDLETTLLGPMVQTDASLGNRTYRPVPASRRARIEDAR